MEFVLDVLIENAGWSLSCSAMVFSGRYLCVLPGISTGREERTCWFAENATVCMFCACSAKPVIRVFEPVLAAWPSGRSICLLEISEVLCRHSLIVQGMHSSSSNSWTHGVYCTRAMHLICRCSVKNVGF